MRAETSARRRRLLRFVGGLTVLVVAAGCAGPGPNDDTTDPSIDSGGPTTPPGGQPEVPAGDDTVVIQIQTGGGLAGPCCQPWTVPLLTAYGSGEVVWVEGTVGQVPGLRRSAVPRSALTDLLGRAQAAGLLAADPDPGTLCCDLPQTLVTLRTGTTTHELSIVGLGHEDDGDDLTDQQRQMRRAVEDLVLLLRDRAEDSDAYGGYAPDEVALYVFSGDTEPDVPVPAWPLANSLAEGGTPVADGGRCLPVTNSDDGLSTRRVLALARDAERSTWSSGGRGWLVYFRPMLPHENACS